MQLSARIRSVRMSCLGLFLIGLVLSTTAIVEGAPVLDNSSRLHLRSVDDVVVTSRASNFVREGPGSFHEVLVVVKEETPLPVLTRKRGWIEVRLPDDRTGWISETSIQEGSAAERASTSEIADEWVAKDATKAGVAAAVRGFQMNADELEKGSVEELMAYIRARPDITEGDIEHFRKPLRRGDRADLDTGDLNFDLPTYNPTVNERQVGMAVASRLVSRGLVASPRVQRYLTLMTEHLTQGMPYYDQSFDVVIIEGEGPDAFACPGGIIFLTRGTFTHFETEAQLAGLLAHEIAHVVRRHGMAERDDREVRRKAESAFAELEQATEDDDEKYEEVEDDLGKMMRESYERVVNDRLLEYEKEADLVAAVMLSEAGYSPMGIVHAVENITTLRSNDPDLFDEDYLEAKNLQERLRHVKSFVRSNGGGEGEGHELPRRFEAYRQELQ